MSGEFRIELVLYWYSYTHTVRIIYVLRDWRIYILFVLQYSIKHFISYWISASILTSGSWTFWLIAILPRSQERRGMWAATYSRVQEKILLRFACTRKIQQKHRNLFRRYVLLQMFLFYAMFWNMRRVKRTIISILFYIFCNHCWCRHHLKFSIRFLSPQNSQNLCVIVRYSHPLGCVDLNFPF